MGEPATRNRVPPDPSVGTVTGAHYAVRVETLSFWTANVLSVTVLPLMLGRSGSSITDFALYVAAAGLGLIMIEDGRNLPLLVRRADIRGYLQVRIALLAAAALSPYLAGRAMGG